MSFDNAVFDGGENEPGPVKIRLGDAAGIDERLPHQEIKAR